jgi:tripartite-type tricarboxylate transporter receptor subunit TctC
MIRRWLLAFLALGAATPALADDFYKGKVVSIITSTGAGGTYDSMARLFARYLGRYIPGNPGFIVRNMPGGGNVIATNYMYNIAAKDGLTIATVHNAMPLNQVLGGAGVAYESDKFNWLGSTGPDNSVIVVRREEGLTSVEDARKRAVNLGSTGAGSGLTLLPLAMNQVLGTRFNIIIGYQSSEELNLALERGEVQARAFSFSSITSQHPDWISKKRMTFLAQIGTKRLKELPDVPLITELAANDEQRGILQLISSPPGLGQPYLAPPGTPPERVAILREAMTQAMRDKGFIEEAAALKFDIDPLSADDVAEIVRSVISARPQIVGKTRELLADGAALGK